MAGITLDQIKAIQNSLKQGSSTPGDRQSYIDNPLTGARELAYGGFSPVWKGGGNYEGGTDVYTDATGKIIQPNEYGQWGDVSQYGTLSQVVDGGTTFNPYSWALPESIAKQLGTDASLLPELAVRQGNPMEAPAREHGGDIFDRVGDVANDYGPLVIALIAAANGMPMPSFGLEAAGADAGLGDITAQLAGNAGSAVSAPSGFSTLLADSGIVSDVPQGLAGVAEGGADAVKFIDPSTGALIQNENLPGLLNSLGEQSAEAFSKLPLGGMADVASAMNVAEKPLMPPASPNGDAGGFPPESKGLSSLIPTGLKEGFKDFRSFMNENKDLISLGALGASALAKPKIPQLDELRALAGEANNSPAAIAAGNAASALIPSVQTGTLPAGAEKNVDDALHDAEQSIKSKYASMGLAGSTMELQEINQARARAAGAKFDMANQLTQTGLQAAGVARGDVGQSASIYEAIMNAQLKEDSALQDALARFAAASAGGEAASAKKEKKAA